MLEFSFADVKQYDVEYNTNFIEQIQEMVGAHAQDGHGRGVFGQLRSDWTLEGIVYALRQTLRYMGYGYKDDMIFYNLGKLVYTIFISMSTT